MTCDITFVTSPNWDVSNSVARLSSSTQCRGWTLSPFGECAIVCISSAGLLLSTHRHIIETKFDYPWREEGGCR